MILADKIIDLRKKNGWSQEELAEKLNVSRQAVSKWESAQSVPDLGRVLSMAEIFGVTTDYLLKDELEMVEFAEGGDLPCLRLEEAHEFLALRARAARTIALATFLCILSPMGLLLLGAASEAYAFAEEAAAFSGLVILFVLVAAAVFAFVRCGQQSEPYAYLEKEDFDTEYGVPGMVREAKKTFAPVYAKENLAGTMLCVLSPLPLFAGAFSGSVFWTILLLCLTMVLAGVGVMCFIHAGVIQASFQKILREGEYSRNASPLRSAVSTFYWLAATGVFLLWSFLGNAWEISWLVWPVAGVAYVGLMAVLSALEEKK